jgi:uncharacterized membrane protein (UPF0127 family)
VRIITFATVEERMIGLQYRRSIEADTLFVFPGIGSADSFHSENVPEPFDIAFLDRQGLVLAVYRMTPTKDVVETPKGTAVALESKAGELARWGVVNGAVVKLRQ